jgi:hypothetical protein
VSAEAADLKCGNCGEKMQLSPLVSVVLIFAPLLQRPYPLLPAEDYRLCTTCDAIFNFVSKAAEAHPSTRESAVGPWSKAIVVYDSGDGAEVRAKRAAEARA